MVLGGNAYSLFLRAATLGDTVDLRTALDTWGAFCDAAEREIQAPGPLTDVTGLASMAASGRLRRADYLEFLGQGDAAAVERSTATALIAAHGESSAQLDVRRTLANSLKFQARYGEALAEFAAIDAAIDPASDPVTFARVALDRAMLLEWLADFDRAEADLAEVEELIGHRFADTPPPEGLFATLLSAVSDASGTEERVALQTLRMDIAMTRALIAKRSGNLDRATELFGSIRDHYEAIGTGAAIDFHLMHLDVLRGDTQPAFDRFADLDAAMRNDPRFHAKIPVLHWVAAEAMVSRDPTWALARLHEGLPVLEQVGDLEVLWKLYRTAAVALAALDRPDEATDRFLDSARTVDQLRRVPLGYRLESTYFANRLPMFNEAIGHAAEHDHASAALELIELAKSRSLATMIYGAQQPAAINPLTQRADELSREIDAWDMRSFDGQQVDPEQRRAVVAERTELIEQIRAGDPRWRAVTEPQAISAEAIVAALDGAIAVTLFVHETDAHERAVVAVTLDAAGVHVDRHVVQVKVWDEVDAYCDNVRRAEDPWAYDLSGFGEVGLSDLLPASTVARLLQHDRAVIVPHGKLHLVPWSSLEIAAGQRLFERVGVAMMPNLMCLPALDGSWPATPSAWIVGAPDYSATSALDTIDDDGREFDMLRKVWEQTATGSLLGSSFGVNSTEATLRGALAGVAELVHISCHGIVDHREPSASALVATDGKVDASEVAGSGTCPAEVVLAACSIGSRPQSAGGVALSGDDVVGLPAAFLEAGARSILMSIPEAHDATSVEFMTRLHLARAAGMSPIKAFQATQIAMLDVEDPALWCGYVMYGSPSNQMR